MNKLINNIDVIFNLYLYEDIYILRYMRNNVHSGKIKSYKNL